MFIIRSLPSAHYCRTNDCLSAFYKKNIAKTIWNPLRIIWSSLTNHLLGTFEAEFPFPCYELDVSCHTFDVPCQELSKLRVPCSSRKLTTTAHSDSPCVALKPAFLIYWYPDKTSEGFRYYFDTLKNILQKRPMVDRCHKETKLVYSRLTISGLLRQNPENRTLSSRRWFSQPLKRIWNVFYTNLHLISSKDYNYARKSFSFATGKSIFPAIEAFLLAYVRFIMNQEIRKQLFFAKNWQTNIKFKSLLNILREYFIEEVNSTNYINSNIWRTCHVC